MKQLVPVGASVHATPDPGALPQRREPRLGQDGLVEEEQGVAGGRGGQDAAQVEDGVLRRRHPCPRYSCCKGLRD